MKVTVKVVIPSSSVERTALEKSQKSVLPQISFILSGSATPGRARSNDLAGRSTALAPALPIALLCFGNSVNEK